MACFNGRMLETVALALLVMAAAAGYGFARPRGIWRAAAVLMIAALAAPFVIGIALAPFLGGGAGMGVAFILVALAALLTAAGVFAALGAGARHGWNLLRRTG